MSLFKRKTPEEKAAAKAEKDRRKAETRAMWDDMLAERKQAKEAKEDQRRRRINDMLQPEESIEAEFRTAEMLMKKDVVFTSKRLLLSLKGSEEVESIPYRAVTSFRTQNFITKDIVLHVEGRKEKELELVFDNETDRDDALAVLNKYAL